MILSRKLYNQFSYLRSLYNGMSITFMSFIKQVFNPDKKMFINYPEEKGHYSDSFRGLPYLTIKEDGALRCTSCMLCVSYCPAKCIHIEAKEEIREEEGTIVDTTPISFKIELLRCIYCGLCEEACPVDAIRMGKEYEIAGHVEREWVLDDTYLAHRSSLNNGRGIISVVDDLNRLKIRL